MTYYADSIWQSKLSRLQDPNLEKMKPLVELMGELRERSQEKGEPRSLRDQPPGCPGILRARRLPFYGSTTMKHAVGATSLVQIPCQPMPISAYGFA
jgi:hypothetical protein